ncbi:bifunctional NUDIX hydrolase/phosphatase PAP2 family protein [Enterovibrio sp. 27052020O]|uniref:bifunctional NUDIX hydrolase/phosphatase PAP2 family protein n=1 Tax=Enterovibrio sp. 27052020O TaxID=3241166 RepID=UPI00388E15ED
MTRDILNNRISIPGGYVDSDNPADAAIRETLEETGVPVEAVGELARMNNAILFDCRATSPIPVLKTDTDKARVAAWQAEHFGREVRAVYLMKPNQEMLDNARFPEQVEMFPALVPLASPSPIQLFDDFSRLSSPFNTWNASLNRDFQQAIDALPSSLAKTVSVFLDYASALGSGVLFFLLIPVALATGGLKRLAQLLFVTVAVTVVVAFGKLFFAVPRPFYLFPELQLASASGFAFPSGHTATAFAIWGLIYTWLNHARKVTVAVWLIPAVLVALSRVYLGVHYVTDVLAGAVLGALAVLGAQRLTASILTTRFWLVLGALIVPFALTQIQPTFLYCAAFSLTFAGTLAITNQQFKGQTNTPMGWKGFLVALAGMVALAAGLYFVSQISNSSIEILIASTMTVALLAVWLGFVTPRWCQPHD